MSDIQFKSTRTDGRDFYTGSVDYAAIARVRDVCRDPSKRMLATSHMNVEWVDLNAILNALEGDNDVLH